MKRRKLLFWVSLGLFQVGEALRIDGLDRLAAATLNRGRRFRPSVSPTRAPSAGAMPTNVVESTPAPAVQAVVEPDEVDDGKPGEASAKRRARHGRPPSRWLRSLEAEELQVWLKTIEPPEAGVSGMTFWTHLTRDHSFDPEKIEGLTIDEQAKLHAAAHDGY